jgi:microcystin degradation protein MlrC
VLVEHLFDGRFTYSGGPLGGVAGSLGRSAVLRLGKLRVLATTHPAYEYGDEQFSAAGIDLQHCRFAVVKNPVNARLAIPNQAFLVLDTVGPTSPRLAELPWRRLNGPCFPMADAPAPLWRA